MVATARVSQLAALEKLILQETSPLAYLPRVLAAVAVMAVSASQALAQVQVPVLSTLVAQVAVVVIPILSWLTAMVTSLHAVKRHMDYWPKVSVAVAVTVVSVFPSVVQAQEQAV